MPFSVYASDQSNIEDVEVTRFSKPTNLNPNRINVSYGAWDELTEHVLFHFLLPYCEDNVILINRSLFSLVTSYRTDQIFAQGFDNPPPHPDQSRPLVCNISRTRIIDFKRLTYKKKDINKIPSFLWFSLTKEVRWLPPHYWAHFKGAQIDTLNLSFTPFIDNYIKQLVSIPSIKTLNLYNSKINDACVAALAQNTNLIKIDLSFNAISDESAAALAGNTVLKTLILASNSIGDLGAQAFINNITLTTLDLYDNSISEPVQAKLKRNTKIKNLYL